MFVTNVLMHTVMKWWWKAMVYPRWNNDIKVVCLQYSVYSNVILLYDAGKQWWYDTQPS